MDGPVQQWMDQFSNGLLLVVVILVVLYSEVPVRMEQFAELIILW